MTAAESYASQGDFPTQGAPPTPMAVLDAVARHGHVTVDDLIDKGRRQHVAHTRMLACYLLRQHTDLSFPAIGRLIGGRDHSTVIHACDLIKARMAAFEAFRTTVLEVSERIQRSGS